MIIIKSDCSEAKFNTLGAELKSLKINGKEYIYGGDSEFWDRSSPILFPICSSLKDNEYVFENKSYTLTQHGYARDKEFLVTKQSQNSVTFTHKSDSQTKAVYPFDYTLNITYTLEGKKLSVMYEVKNDGIDTMYFSIGSHEGYLCSEGIEDYEVVFPQNKTLYTSVLSGKILGNERKCVLKDSDTLRLDYKYFSVDALIFKDIDFNTVILKNRKTAGQIKIDFEDFKYMLIWSKPNAPFVSIELWCGITDNVDTDKNLKTKEGINALAGGKIFSRTHSIEISD